MYRRLALDEGVLGRCSLLSRALSAQMLRLSDRHGRIQFQTALPPLQLAKEVAYRLGAGRSDRRIMGRLMEELIEAQAWTWDGEFLVAGPFVMEPAKDRGFGTGPKKKPKKPVRLPTTNSRDRSTSGPDDWDKSWESFGSGLLKRGPSLDTISGTDLDPDPHLDTIRRDEDLVSNLGSNLKKDLGIKIENSPTEKPGWLRAAKLVSDLFEAETDTCWMLHHKHHTDLGQLWDWSEKMAPKRGTTTELMLSATVTRWLRDPWIKDRGWPFATLAKEPQKYATPTKEERARTAETIKNLKEKRRRLYMAGMQEESEKVTREIRKLTG